MCLILFHTFTFTEKNVAQTPVITKRSSCLTAMEAFERCHKEKLALQERELLLKEKELEFQKQKMEFEEEDSRKIWQTEDGNQNGREKSIS